MIDKLQELLETFEHADALLKSLHTTGSDFRMQPTIGDMRHDLLRFTRVVKCELHYQEIDKLALLLREIPCPPSN